MAHESESKRDRFSRLAERRMNDLIEKFRLVGNLADRRNYDYTDDQAKQIIRAVEGQARELKQRFQADDTPREKSFRFTAEASKNG